MIDGLGRHDELIGDVDVPQALADQTQDIELSSRQTRRIRSGRRPRATRNGAQTELAHPPYNDRGSGVGAERVVDVERGTQVVGVVAPEERERLFVWTTELAPGGRRFGKATLQQQCPWRASELRRRNIQAGTRRPSR